MTEARKLREAEKQPGSSHLTHRAGWAEVEAGFDDDDE